MRTIIINNGTLVEYQVLVKKVKNMTLRVRPNGEIIVSVPRRVSQEKIDAFVRSHIDWIQKAKKRYQSQILLSIPTQIRTGMKLLWLGDQREVFVEQAQKDEVIVFVGKILIRTKNSEPNHVATVYAKWYQNEAKRVLQEAIDQVYPLFSAYAVKKPVLAVRKMKSRWGSCSVSKGKVTLNSYLCQLPMEQILSVPAHELCHLIHPNHSAEFYSTLETILPGYQNNRQKLKQYSIL